MQAMTDTLYCPADLANKLDQGIHPWLLSERSGGGSSKLSYVKVDVLSDTLNTLFGPLGWSVKAEITQKEDFQYEKPANNGYPAKEMYVFQVISQVTLTIKPMTPNGTETVFQQSGIGYGEVAINAHRKDAVGMAVKGAESDGLKRCCNFLGRALGMFLVGGQQDPIVYAHNGAQNNRSTIDKARRQRDDYERDQRRSGDDAPVPRLEDRRDDRDRGEERPRQNAREDRPREDRPREEQRQQRDPAPREDRQRDQGTRDEQRQRDPAPREDRPREPAAREEQRSRSDAPREERQREDRGQADQSSKTGDAAKGEVRDDARSDAGRDAPAEGGRRRAAPKDGADKGGDGKVPEKGEAKPEVKTRRKASTTFNLQSVPVTREQQTDFAATFVHQIGTMRQPEDQVQMMKLYAERINGLDPDVRSLLVERLKERSVDVTLLD